MKIRRALLGLSLVATISVTLVVLTGSEAATPGAGTVSASNTSVRWDGTYKVPTGGGCTSGSDASCDLYSLAIDPPAYTFQVVVKLQPVGDWDLSVWAPNGGLAGSSGNAPNQTETVVLVNPPAGTYVVAAAPFAPAPGAPTYTASATIIPSGASTVSSGSAHLTFSNYAAPAGMGQSAGEPSLGGDLRTGKVMYQAGLDTLRTTFNDATSPATASWENVSFPQTSVASLDPIGFMDQHTNRWFSSQLSGTTSLAALTDDDGTTWIPSEGGPGNGGVDHQTFGGGPYHAPLTGGTPLYPDAVYYCSQDLVAALCARSDNGGVSFAPAVPIYTSECGGLHGHVEVGPDGTVYVPNKNCDGHQAVVVSEDNGLTWSVRPLLSSGPGAWDPAVSTASDGTLYFAYDDADGHAKVAVSHDRGLSWTNIRDVGGALGVNQSAFPVAIAGDPGRAAVGFLGTSETSAGAFGDDPSWPGVWYVYVAESTDGGDTWTTINAAPGDPAQRGTICAGGFNGCNNGTRNLLDFMDASMDSAGRVLIGYPDGCIDACIAAGPGTFSAVATIAREVSGPRLLARFDSAGVPAAPSLYAKSSAGPPASNVLTWQEPDDHGSAITGYRVYRNGALLTSVSGTTYTDTAIASGTKYTYEVSAVNGAGEGPKSPPVTPEAVVVVPPANPCAEPGTTILTDTNGDSADGDPAKDVQSLSIAEPREIGLGKLEFILKVASLSSVPPNTTWPVQLKTANGADHWVRMSSSALGAVTFGYGDGTNYSGTATAADPLSSYNVDGTIRIVVPRSVWGVNAGDTLTDFLTRVSVYIVAGNLTPDNMPNTLARTGTYTVKGNENCATPKPDLSISGSDIAFSGLQGTGHQQVLVAVVHNSGTADATAVPVRFSVDGVQVGATQTVARIAAGGTARVSVVWDTRGQNGPHTVAVTADPAGVIAETSESNNTGTRIVTVQGGKVT
jgi:hypothetical protein